MNGSVVVLRFMCGPIFDTRHRTNKHPMLPARLRKFTRDMGLLLCLDRLIEKKKRKTGKCDVATVAESVVECKELFFLAHLRQPFCGNMSGPG